MDVCVTVTYVFLEQEVMGVASIFDLYSTWEGPFLFIDEFLIHPQAEGITTHTHSIHCTMKKAWLC